MSLQKRLNAVEKAIHWTRIAAHSERWLVEQDAHWRQDPLDPIYSKALEILISKREELKKIKDSEIER